MAITYHAGRRLQGLAYTASTITKDEDFSDVWNGVGTGVTVSGGEATWNVAGNQDNQISKAIGSTLSDTTWVAQFEIELSAYSSGEANILALSSGTAVTAQNSTDDTILVRLNDTGKYNVSFRTGNGTDYSSVSTIDKPANGTRHYLTLVRNSSTEAILYVRTVSHTGTQVTNSPHTVTQATMSGATGLDTVTQGGWNTGQSSRTLTMVGDNLKIYNGMTTPSGTATFEDDYSNDSVWTSANPTYSSVNASTEKLDFDWDNGDGGSDKQMRYDLTSVATNWILRFKLNWSVVTAQSNAYMYVGLTDNVGGAGVSQSGFELRFINALLAQYTNFGVNQLSSELPHNVGGSGNNMVYTAAKDYYVEMKKDGTSLTATVFENSDYTGMWQTATETITTTITPSLRYLHFWNSMSANTGIWEGTIDDVEFYNDATTAVKTTIGDAKPANVQAGSRLEETDTRKMYHYNSTGSVTTSGSDTIITFTEDGTFTPTSSFSVQYLVIGGGGGASYDRAGGGGAGGFLTGNSTLSSGTYPITVGTGGLGGGKTGVDGGNSGVDSTFNGLTAYGGGRGGVNNFQAENGGSGGGANWEVSTVGTGISGQGNSGGVRDTGSPYRGGGGGGAGGAGLGGHTSVGTGGGGAGIANPISGSTIGELSSGTYYVAGGGGGGAFQAVSGVGGIGGGGDGGTSSAKTGQDGLANTGSGGGSAYGGAGDDGGSGGLGVVIIKFATSGNTYTVSNTWKEEGT